MENTELSNSPVRSHHSEREPTLDLAGEWENPINLASGLQAVSSCESSEHLALSLECSPIPSPERYHYPMQAPSVGKRKDDDDTEASRPEESDQPAELTIEPQTQPGTDAGPSVPPKSGILAETLASELLRATKGKGKATSPDDDDVPLRRRKAQLLPKQIVVLRSRLDVQGKAFNIASVRILDQDLHFHPDLASTLQDLSVDTLFASIGQELRKLHFRVTRSEIIRNMIVRWSVSGETFGGKHPTSR